MGGQPSPTALEPPRGTVQVHVDDRGRLKLPADFRHYLDRLGEHKVFITSLDLEAARIYPISVWRENEVFFENAGEDSPEAEDVAMMANHYGADSEIDGQGRVLLPAALRRELKLEDAPAWLQFHRGAIDVFADEVYRGRVAAARENLPEKARRLKKKGLK